MNNNKQNVWGKARWIGAHVRCSALEYAPVFRRCFIAKPFKKAVCAICGLGHFQLKINGTVLQVSQGGIVITIVIAAICRCRFCGGIGRADV